MQRVEAKLKIYSREWLEAELRNSNRELKKLRQKAADEKRERKFAQAELFNLRRGKFS